tara:strand:+ start:469 stop:588 length:120 start_codon:yes stop_codon:yes gene_type:complete
MEQMLIRPPVSAHTHPSVDLQAEPPARGAPGMLHRQLLV